MCEDTTVPVLTVCTPQLLTQAVLANEHRKCPQQSNLNVTKSDVSNICAEVNAVDKSKATAEDVKRSWLR